MGGVVCPSKALLLPAARPRVSIPTAVPKLLQAAVTGLQFLPRPVQPLDRCPYRSFVAASGLRGSRPLGRVSPLYARLGFERVRGGRGGASSHLGRCDASRLLQSRCTLGSRDCGCGIETTGRTHHPPRRRVWDRHAFQPANGFWRQASTTFPSTHPLISCPPLPAARAQAGESRPPLPPPRCPYTPGRGRDVACPYSRGRGGAGVRGPCMRGGKRRRAASVRPLRWPWPSRSSAVCRLVRRGLASGVLLLLLAGSVREPEEAPREGSAVRRW